MLVTQNNDSPINRPKVRCFSFLLFDFPDSLYKDVSASITNALSGAEETFSASQVTGFFNIKRRAFRMDLSRPEKIIKKVLSTENPGSSIVKPKYELGGNLNEQAVIDYSGNVINSSMQPGASFISSNAQSTIKFPLSVR